MVEVVRDGGEGLLGCVMWLCGVEGDRENYGRRMVMVCMEGTCRIDVWERLLEVIVEEMDGKMMLDSGNGVDGNGGEGSRNGVGGRNCHEKRCGSSVT